MYGDASVEPNKEVLRISVLRPVGAAGKVI